MMIYTWIDENQNPESWLTFDKWEQYLAGK